MNAHHKFSQNVKVNENHIIIKYVDIKTIRTVKSPLLLAMEIMTGNRVHVFFSIFLL